MGANLSTPEKITKLARQGDSANLQLLLADLQRNDAQFRANRARYLEVPDEGGSTPLTLAASRGSVNCVKLLIQFGADVHHVSMRPEGGSALHEAVAHKHDAVVEVLLRQGANPFVENSKGFSAMDIACSGRSVALLRRLEQCAPYAGWVQMKVPQFGGLGATWQRRWVVVSHRYPNPRAPPSQQLTHCVFLAYKALATTAPVCRVWLDGAKAREVYNPKAEARLQATPPGAAHVAQAGITLHRKHEAPTGVYATGGHSALVAAATGGAEGYTFYVRPDDGSPAAVAALDKLIRTINNRGFPPTAAAPGASAATAASSSYGPPPPRQQQAPAAAASQQQQQQQYPPAPSPLFSSMTGLPAMATAPGNWGSFPPPPSPGDQLAGAPSDEELARRLQEQYDAEMAQQLHQQDGGAPPQQQQQQCPQSAPSFAAGGSQDMSSGGSGGGPSFYPQVHGDQPGSAPAAPRPPQQQQPAYPLYGTSSAPPAMAAAMQAAAAVGGSSGRPSTSAAGSAAPQGRPSAPPAMLLDVDYPPIRMPLAAGQLPVSASGRQMSAPRLEDDSWWSAAPAAPTSRPASESNMMGAAAVVAAAAAGAAPSAPTVITAPGGGDDSSMCVFCMDAPATAGVLHGDSVHKCLCKECATHLKESGVDACPMCRDHIEAYIMRVF